MKRYFSRNSSLIVLVAFLLPLFYINVKTSHDWGDDFAQYFIQARNILEHRPQTDNGLVFDKQSGEYALQAYPVGFPVILSTAWFFFGDSILVSSLTVSVFFFAFGIVCFFYFRKYFNDVLSILLTLMIIYNPLTIGFKKEILSDVPFAFFFLWGVLLFLSAKKNTGYLVLTGIAWGFALSVRGIGATLFVAAGFYLLQNIFQEISGKEKSNLKPAFRKITIISISAFGFYFLLNGILFPVPSGRIIQFYADAISGENFGKWIFLNVEYYYHVFLNFFSTMGGNFRWLSTATKFILVAFIPPGIFLAFRRKPEFKDWIFLAYIFVLFIYPYSEGGFRFLYPVMPFLAHYIFNFFFRILKLFRITSEKPAVTFLCIILIQYTPGLIDHVNSMSIPEEGPQEIAAMEAFDYIRHLPTDAVVVFMKPRALSFYSDRRSAYVQRTTKPQDLEELFTRMNAHYFLVPTKNGKLHDMLLEKFIEDHGDDLKLIYKNSTFNLFTDLK